MPYMTTSDVAAEAIRRGDRLTPDAIRRATRAGRIIPAVVTERGQRLYERETVERWLAERAARRGAAA